MAARKKKNLSKTLRKLSGSAVTKKELERIKKSLKKKKKK